LYTSLENESPDGKSRLGCGARARMGGIKRTERMEKVPAVVPAQRQSQRFSSRIGRQVFLFQETQAS